MVFVGNSLFTEWLMRSADRLRFGLLHCVKNLETAQGKLGKSKLQSMRNQNFKVLAVKEVLKYLSM
jgi:hypothetical protein